MAYNLQKNGKATKLTDTRKYNNGRPIEKNMTIEEKYKKFALLMSPTTLSVAQA